MAVDYATARPARRRFRRLRRGRRHPHVRARRDDQDGHRRRPRRRARRGRRDLHGQPLECLERDHRRRPGLGTIIDNDAAAGSDDRRRDRHRGQRRHRHRHLHGQRSARVSGRTVTVDYATANASATAPGDYTAANGTLTFAAGETTKTSRSWSRRRARRAERDLHVNLSNAQTRRSPTRRASARSPTTTACRPLAINDVTVTEGNARHRQRHLHRHLDAASGQTGHRRLRHRERHGHQRRPTTRRRADTLTFAPGQTSKPSRSPYRRRPGRGDETFVVNLSNAIERDDRRPAGHRHDHRQRPAAERCRSTT